MQPGRGVALVERLARGQRVQLTMRYLAAGEGNPLRRRSDSIEGRVTLLLAGLFFAACVAATVVAWHSYTAGVAQERAEAANRHPVGAVTVERAPSGEVPSARLTEPWVQVPARWTGPDGSPHEGPVTVRARSETGTRVPLWVNGVGRAVSPPQERSDTVAQAALEGLAVVGLSAAALLTAGRVVRLRLDRGRLAAWDAEWERVGPRWTRGR